MELTYHRNGNYLFPNLILENEAEEPVGKYGLLRKQYLKEHKTNWYMSMLLTGKLDRHLAEIDRSAQPRYSRARCESALREPNLPPRFRAARGYVSADGACGDGSIDVKGRCGGALSGW